jgi:hypothetical protein
MPLGTVQYFRFTEFDFTTEWWIFLCYLYLAVPLGGPDFRVTQATSFPNSPNDQGAAVFN